MDLEKILSLVKFAYLIKPLHRSWPWTTPWSCKWHIASGCGLRRRFFVLILLYLECCPFPNGNRGMFACLCICLPTPPQKQICAVDDTSVFGMDLDRIFLLVLGEEGTEVRKKRGHRSMHRTGIVFQICARKPRQGRLTSKEKGAKGRCSRQGFCFGFARERHHRADSQQSGIRARPSHGERSLL
jgi:hypothetical protein